MSTTTPFAHQPELLLADHHHQIEALCSALSRAMRANDSRAVIEEFRALEHAVIEHLDAEEEDVLPAYSLYAPADAQTIRATHAELRRRMYKIGVDIELHRARADVVDDLVTALRLHATHEERGMYRWAIDGLSLRGRRHLFVRVGELMREAARAPR